MDDLTIIAIVLIGAVVGAYAIRQYSSIKRVVISQNKARMAKVREARGKTPEPTTPGVGPWLVDLLDELGYGPEVLMEEEMPEELVQLLDNPMVKGFIDGLGRKGEGETAPPREGAENISGIGWF